MVGSASGAAHFARYATPEGYACPIRAVTFRPRSPQAGMAPPLSRGGFRGTEATLRQLFGVPGIGRTQPNELLSTWFGVREEASNVGGIRC